MNGVLDVDKWQEIEQLLVALQAEEELLLLNQMMKWKMETKFIANNNYSML